MGDIKDKEAYELTYNPPPDQGQVNEGFNADEAPNATSNFGGTSVDPEKGDAAVVPVVEDDGPKREQWDNPIEFLLSCIAMSVGLGNIWRFPFIAYKNGGGAFIIPYLIVLTFIGRPVYFLELILGQFSSYGQVKVWKLSPIFRGIGYGAMVGTICTVSFYAAIMGITVFYFFSSFQKTLPWAECNDDWVGLGRGSDMNENGTMEAYLYCNESDLHYAYDMRTENRSEIIISQLYFENEVLHQIPSIDDGLGAPEWRLTLCLLFSWILIWGSLIKGVSSSGKVAYFTALFPYVVLLIMLIRGVTLPGAWEGIKLFITPDFEKMLEPNIWYEAVGQCFFSLSTGFGPIIMFASYNPFKHNIYRDAWIISGMDTFTSLLAGFTVFAVLGNLAHEHGVEVDKVAMPGPGLTFISYPAAIALFDWVPQLFSVLFYLMLFTLGVGSATSLTGGVITIVCDQFPKIPRWQVTSVICFAGFLSGLMYMTPGGQFMTELIGFYGATFLIYIMVVFEIIAISYVYGLSSFLKDIEFMLGIKVGWYWKFCWGFFIPVGLSVVLVYNLATMKRLTYGEYDFPDSAIIAGWVLAAGATAILPIMAVQIVRTRKGDGWMAKLKKSFQATPEWGPRQPSVHAEWVQFKQINK